jgi:hypothetical protein
MESFFSSLKAEQRGRKTYGRGMSDVFDHIERFQNLQNAPLDARDLSPMEFEMNAQLAYAGSSEPAAARSRMPAVGAVVFGICSPGCARAASGHAAVQCDELAPLHSIISSAHSYVE